VPNGLSVETGSVGIGRDATSNALEVEGDLLARSSGRIGCWTIGLDGGAKA
jgi:hypothetical protein